MKVNDNAACKNMRPKIPEDLPKGYYFRVYPSTDRYGRESIVVALYRKRTCWFDKRLFEDENILSFIRPQEPVRYVEYSMRDQVRKLRERLHNEKYLYGRHP